MRFLFVWHSVQRLASLEEIYSGDSSRNICITLMRWLYCLAGRGHQVTIVGNIPSEDYQGISAKDGLGEIPEIIGASQEPLILVLANSPDERLWKLVLQHKRANVRIVLWGLNPFETTWMKRLSLGEIDRIVCISKYERDCYRIYPGFEKVEYAYLGVSKDLVEAAPASSRSANTVLFISIPNPSKGFHHLLKAWPKVIQEEPRACLRVCGSALLHNEKTVLGKTGVLGADLEADFPDYFCNPAGFMRSHQIRLLGELSFSQVFTEMKSAALGIVNLNQKGSLENYCRAAVEAQLAGLPVVGAARGALPEVIAHAKTGYLLSSSEPQEVAGAIIRLLRDTPARQAMGDAGPGWAAKFASYDASAEMWEKIAQRCLSGISAPVEPQWQRDTLRNFGWGSLRISGRQILKRFQGR